DNRKIKAVNELSLELKKGEILGIAGIDGNGQTELVEALTGLRKAAGGRVLMADKDITNKNPLAVFQHKISSIPQDRQKHGLVLDFSVAENLVLEIHGNAPFAERGILQHQQIEEHAKKLIDKFDIRPQDCQNQIARSLSGGNQQKVIIAREVNNDPQVLIAVQPTRGLDVGAIEYVHSALVKQRDMDKAVLLVSLELDEVINLSDRIAVIYEGKIVKLLDAKDADVNEIGLLMAGGKA
ncbi:MAG: ATP-binding cassette domain-containing protein, partial [Candidatus Cloacimonadales bacterium]